MNNTTSMNRETTSKRRASLTRFAGAVGAGFAGLFVLPILGTLGVSFALIGAGLPVLSVLNLIGLTHIPFNLLLWQVVGVPQIFVALLVGGVFLGLGWLCLLGLKKFFAFSRWLTR